MWEGREKTNGRKKEKNGNKNGGKPAGREERGRKRRSEEETRACGERIP